MLVYFVIGFFSVSPLSAGTTNSTSENAEVDVDSFYPSLQWSDSFDWKLLKVLSNQSTNVLISPLSLRLVLAVLYEGAGGSTEREFEVALKFSKKSSLREKYNASLSALLSHSNADNLLKIATRIFLDDQIEAKEKFTEQIQQYYHTDIVSANFTDPESASKDINAWVQDATLGSISQLTSPGDLQDMTMLLANAIYFKGIWRRKFPKENTCVDKFFVKPTHSIYIPYMTMTEEFYFHESPVLDAKILRLPYKNSDYSMFIILPMSRGGLPDLIQRINLVEVHQELYSLTKKLVQISIPKFKFTFKTSYAKVLRDFGFRTMFQNTASFPKIAKGNSTLLRKLVISDILQTTGVAVDEDGSIAYAATDVIIGNKIGVPEDSFNATHPFLFFIQEDREGSVFYIGKMENPLQQELEIISAPNDDENM